MSPFQTLTAIAVSTIDLRHHLTDLEVEPQPVGIALFSGQLCDGLIHFDLQVCVLEPTESGARLLEWLDAHAPADGTTIAGYDVGAEIVPMLRSLAEIGTSYGINVLGGRRGRTLIDIHGPAEGTRRAGFAALCDRLQIPVDRRDANERFLDWTFNRQERAVEGISIDVIATWRVALALIGARTRLGAEVARTAENQLQDWLAAADSRAALIHRGQLGC